MNTLLRTIFLFTYILASFSAKGQTYDVSYWYEKSIDSIDAFYRLADSTKHRVSEEYVKKAQKDKNLSKISEAYVYKLIAYSNTKKALSFGDSIISLSTRTKNTKLLGIGYMNKGIQLYYLDNFSQALDNYLRAHTIFTEKKYPFYHVKLRHYFGLLKLYTEHIEEANAIFIENIAFFEKKPLYLKTHTNQYYRALYALAVSYKDLKNFSKSKQICEKVLQDKNIKESYLYPYFLTLIGRLERLNKNYSSSLGYYHIFLEEISPSKKNDIATVYYYIYEVLKESGKNELALAQLKKIDSLYKLNPEVIKEAQKANFEMYEYYKSTKDRKKQLEKLNTFFTIDSILKQSRANINERILNNYEIQPLLEEKRKLIAQLAHESNQDKSIIYVLLSIGLLLTSLIFYRIRKTKLYKKRFDALMQSNTGENNKEILTTRQNATNSKSTLSEETKNQILKKLYTFERKQLFLHKKFTLVSLAKELGTNSTYLSKIINEEKQCNFANYLNQLKINYAIERLKMDTTFRKYTVKAIAEASGFNNSQSFSSSFYKQTGIYPSYFIKQLTQQVQNQSEAS